MAISAISFKIQNITFWDTSILQTYIFYTVKILDSPGAPTGNSAKTKALVAIPDMRSQDNQCKSNLNFRVFLFCYTQQVPYAWPLNIQTLCKPYRRVASSNDVLYFIRKLHLNHLALAHAIA